MLKFASMKQVAARLAALALAALLMAGAGEALAAPAEGLARPVAAWPVQRAGMYGDYNPREAVQSGRALPLHEVLARIRPQIAGNMRDASLVNQGGRPVYLIRFIMQDGSVAIVSADAATGRVLNIRRGGR